MIVSRPGSGLPQRDSGATLVMVALSLTLLLGFAAVAIDATGFGFNERRQHQSAADVGALAAVQFAVPNTSPANTECAGFSGLTRSRCNGAIEAMEVANATLDAPSLADWTDASKCPDRPASFAVSPVSPCVAFNVNNQRAWVKIPLVEKPTTLARVIGITSVTVSADAIAGSSIGIPSGVLPFLLPGNASGVDYNCLKASSNPNFGACADLPSVGNFGAMDFYLYGNEDLGYTERCTGDTNGRFNANVARGVDHPLSAYPPPGTGSGRIDQDHCPDFNAQPNMVYAQTGNIDIEQGMLYGGSEYADVSYPGRLQLPGGFLVRGPQGSTVAARIDSTALWSFLSDAASLESTPCDDDVVDTPLEMLACIDWAKSTSTEVFDGNLASSKRFGWTPSVWEPDFTSGTSTAYHIKGYIPVYLDTTFFGCNNNGCDIMHTPGVANITTCPTNPVDAQITCGTPGSGNKDLEAITAYILSTAIVPANAKSPAPGDANQRSFNLNE